MPLLIFRNDLTMHMFFNIMETLGLKNSCKLTGDDATEGDVMSASEHGHNNLVCLHHPSN